MDLADRVLGLLREHGPMSLHAAAGLLETSFDTLFDLYGDRRFFSMDGDFHPAGDVLDGRCLTTAAAAGDVLPLIPDLVILSHFREGFRARLPDGRVVDCEIDNDVVRGPEGWLPAAPRLAVRIVDAADGLVELLPAPQPAVDELTAARIRSTLEQCHLYYEPPDEPPPPGSYVQHAYRTLVVEHPELFTAPGPTFSEMLEAAGWEVHRDEIVMPAGTDPALWDAYLAEEESDDEWAREPGPPGGGFLAELFPDALRLRDLCHSEDPDLDELEDLLAVPAAHAMIGGLAADIPDRLHSLAEAVLERRPGHAGALAARAHVALVRGDADACERDLQLVCDRAPDLGDFDLLAQLYSERGDARGALSLHRRAGAEDDDLDVQLMHRMLTVRASGVGRNDPCPCGSGRKHKRCCGSGQVTRPLPERFVWLRRKLIQFAQEPQHRTLSMDWTEAFFGRFELKYLDEPLVWDAVLWAPANGERLIDRYLRERGHRLPADERELLGRWADTRLQLVEVIDETTLRPIPGDGTVRIRDDIDRPQPGEVALTRLLPDGETLRPVFGYVIPRVRRARIQAALEAGHVELGRELFEPGGPRLSTTDGQELRFCRRRWTTAPDIAERLDELFGPSSDGTWHWLNSTDKIAATLRLEDGDLVAETNALERMSAVSVLLRGSVDELLEDELEYPEDVLAEASPSLSEAPPPEAVEAAETYIAQMEARWVDEPVPALGGITPRQALEDPDRRVDLEELLRDFEATERPGAGFRTGRLRELLGL